MTRISLIALAVSFALASPAVGGARADMPASCSLDRSTGTTLDAAPVISEGYAANWSAPAGRIAFVKRGIGSFFRVLTTRPGGGEVRPIEAGVPQIPLCPAESSSELRASTRVI